MEENITNDTQDKFKLQNLLNDDNLIKLTSLVKEFNPFRILKTQHYEIRHSNFLSWIMSPYETHELADSFLLKFLNSSLDLKISNIKDAEIRREYKNIDLLIISKSNNLVCAIENKVWAEEHGKQLDVYKRIVEDEFKNFNNKRFLFLTRTGKEASNTHYKSVSYIQVRGILVDIKQQAREDIQQFIEQYISILNNDILDEDNKDILNLCNEISCKHSDILSKISEGKIDEKKILNNSDLVDAYQRHNYAIAKVLNTQRKIKEDRDTILKDLLNKIYKDNKAPTMHSNWAYTIKVEDSFPFGQIDYTAQPFEQIKIQFFCGITTYRACNLYNLLLNKKDKIIKHLNDLSAGWNYDFCFRISKKGTQHFTETFIREVSVKKDKLGETIDILNDLFNLEKKLKIGQNSIGNVISAIKERLNENIYDSSCIKMLEEYKKQKKNVIFLPCLYLFNETPYYSVNIDAKEVIKYFKEKTLEGLEILELDKSDFCKNYYK